LPSPVESSQEKLSALEPDDALVMLQIPVTASAAENITAWCATYKSMMSGIAPILVKPCLEGDGDDGALESQVSLESCDREYLTYPCTAFYLEQPVTNCTPNFSGG
jgi:hypothetical protein